MSEIARSPHASTRSLLISRAVTLPRRCPLRCSSIYRSAMLAKVWALFRASAPSGSVGLCALFRFRDLWIDPGFCPGVPPSGFGSGGSQAHCGIMAQGAGALAAETWVPQLLNPYSLSARRYFDPKAYLSCIPKHVDFGFFV